MARKPFGVTADVHMDEHAAYATIVDGFNSRLLAAEAVVLHMAEKIAKRGGDTLVNVGDWFHSRKKVSVNTLHISDRVLRTCKAKYGVDVVGIPGNHDLSQAGNANSVTSQPFAAVWTKPGVVEWRGWKWGMIPWTDDPEVVKSVLRQKADFYFGHFGVADSKVGPSDFEMHGHIRPNVFNNVKSMVFLGHYHKPQFIGRHAMYVGSPLQLSWGEANEKKRFVIVDEEGGFEFCDLGDFPRFVRVTESELDKCRPQDYIEVRAAKQDAVKRVRNKIALKKINAAVVVDKTDADVRPPRLDIAGRAIKQQLTEYAKYRKPPKGFTVKEAVDAALSLMGDAS